MSDPTQQPPGPEPEQQLSAEQEQMLRQMEEEMRKVRIQDLIAQSVVSILNLTYRRIAKEDERDLEQARVGIDAVRALVDTLEPEQQREVRNALSQVQLAYGQLAGGGSGEGTATATEPDSAPGDQATGGSEGPKKPPPGLWVPGR